ncbi:hypothetical protein CRG98_010331 [Punica granatum]|uniref:Major facilitator superfamily (MFS) profile domain-containing protein n=1 Tax=Punica granatum TaxID=22663 RepID=A0A2I0KL89_PUNGR|nr:hypothetical protein CRG98_010331 [Punica granatum]
MEPFLKRFFPQVLHRHNQQPGDQDKSNKYCMFNSRWVAFYGISTFVTGLAGCLFAAVVSKRIGYRKLIFSGTVIYAIGACLQTAAPHGTMLQAGRLVQGLGFGFINQAVPPYLAELSPTGRRGMMIGAVQLFAKIGAFLTNLMNYFIIKRAKEGDGGWRMSLSVMSLPIAWALCLASICFLPDTPHRLIHAANDDKGAEHVLRRVRGTYDVREELHAIIGAGPMSEITLIRSMKLLKKKKYIPVLITGMLIPIFTQLTGVNMLGPIMFRAIGFRQEDALGIETINCLLSLMSTIFVMYYVDKAGRRVWLISGGVMMSISLIMLGVIVKAELGKVPSFVMILVFVIGFGASWGPLGVLITTEIYPSEIRSLGLGISVAASFISSGLTSGFYLPLLCFLEYWIFFALAGAVALVTLYVFMCLPETSGISLEQMPMLQVWGSNRCWKIFMVDDDEENDEESATGPSTSVSTTPSNSSQLSEDTSYASSSSLPKHIELTRNKS